MAGPPSPSFLATVYFVLGTIVSFAITHLLPRHFGGRYLGELPTTAADFAPFAIVVGIFVVAYEAFDVIGAGAAQHAAIAARRTHGVKQLPAHVLCRERLPKSVIFAQRAQTNQVEQAPFLFLATFVATIVASPIVAAALAAVWAFLRIQYGRAYRACGDDEKVTEGLGKYTVPAYMIIGALASLNVVHGARLLL